MIRAVADTHAVILSSSIGSRSTVLTVVPFDEIVAGYLHQVERSKVPDMPDRIIAATALSLGIPLISRDRKIQVSAVTTIW